MSRRGNLDKGLTNYGDPDFASYLRRSFAKWMGYSSEMLGRPIVGLATSASGFNNCHRLTPELVEAISRGVLAAGGLAARRSRRSPWARSSSIRRASFFRNLMSMDVGEMIRAQPMSAVVLVGGCDKTVPAQLMGALSAGVPAIQLVVGPMMTGRYNGERLGACTDCRRFWGRFRSGQTTTAGIEGDREQPRRHGGHVRRHGNGEHHGVPGRGARDGPARQRVGPGGARRPPADRRGDRRRSRQAGEGGLGHRPESSRARRSRTPPRVLLAIGGSANGVIHLAAIAGRVGRGASTCEH